MFDSICFLWKKRCFLLLLPLVLLCGCGSLGAEVSPTPTSATQQTAPTPTATTATQQVSATPTSVQQPAPTPTSATQIAFTSYVGKWEVHGSLLTINGNKTGLEQWNVGPCSDTGQMCNGNAHITFVENADGSVKGIIQSVSYSQWNGNPAPTGFRPDAADPRAGDTFQLQHSGAHLLYTTWFGNRSQLNSGNRYWCDAYAVKSGWKQCGA